MDTHLTCLTLIYSSVPIKANIAIMSTLALIASRIDSSSRYDVLRPVKHILQRDKTTNDARSSLPSHTRVA
jgi:hypothetical protein